MKKLLIPILLTSLLLTCCGANQTTESDSTTIACTTYPVYLMTNSILKDIDGFETKLVISQDVSCLHDYTLTMTDMEIVERADVIVCSGAGLESFLDDVLDGRKTIDSSSSIDLIMSEEEGEFDPHIWMDPDRAEQMVQNIANSLSELYPELQASLLANAETAVKTIHDTSKSLHEEVADFDYPLITFHDGFSYFAQSFGFNLVAAVEEEEGSEASAKTINEIVHDVNTYHLPAIFTEKNGSDATAKTICRECNIHTFPLDMCMSGHGSDINDYCDVIRQNVMTIKEAYS